MSSTSHHLVFAGSDYTDTTIDCDTLGLRYQVRTEKLPSSGFINRKKLVTFTKTLADVSNVTIGEWETNFTKSDFLRVPALTGKESRERKTVFPEHNQSVTFTTPDGKQYKWKLHVNLWLQCTDLDGTKHRVATFHERRCLFRKRKAYIELHSGYEDVLDILVVAFVIAYRVREEQVAAASSS